MAQIELRNTIIRLKDGFTGTALVNDTPANLDTTVVIDTVASLPDSGTHVPIGARFLTEDSGIVEYTVTAQNSNEVQQVVADATSGNFTITFNTQTTGNILYNASAMDVQTALEALSNIAPGDVVVTSPVTSTWLIQFAGTYADTNVAQVTASDVDLMGGGTTVTPSTVHPGGTTWELTFTPAFSTAAGVPDDDDDITFLPIQIEIKIGEGNLTWTENREMEYVLDRGNLDTVREGDQQPLELNIDFVYEFYTAVVAGTYDPTPIDFLKRQGDASNLSSAATDPCEPFAIDVEIEYTPPCSSDDPETVLFPDFRYESLEFDLSEATISVTGKCNSIQPSATRG